MIKFVSRKLFSIGRLVRFDYANKNTEQNKINEIKIKREYQQKEEIKRFNEDINKTKGNFNSFTEYLWLYRNIFAGVGFGLSIIYIQWKLFCIGGLEQEDQDSQKQRWDFISVNYENQKGKQIYNIFKNQFQIKHLPQHSVKSKRLSKIKDKTGYNFEVIDENEFIFIVLPNSKILVSMGLLSLLNEAELYRLTLLHSFLFKQRLHIRQLSFFSIAYYLFPQNTLNQLKLRQIYTRKYTNLQLRKQLQLIKQKYEIEKDQIGQIFKKIHESQSKISISLSNRFTIV